MRVPLILALVCIVLMGCGPAPTATQVAVQPTATLTATVTATSTATPTDTQTATHKPAPALTPTRTATVTPSPIPTLNPMALELLVPSLAVRECPASDCTVLFKVEEGAAIEAMAHNGNAAWPWYQVSTDDGLGWVVGTSVHPLVKDLWESLPTPAPTITLTPSITPTPRPLKDLQGLLFFDHNGSGLRDQGEPPIANFTVCAKYAGQKKVCSRTDEEGRYAFKNLAPKNAKVTLSFADPNRGVPPQGVQVHQCVEETNCDPGL